MAVSPVKAVFQTDVKSIWDIVTSLENYSWRSDIEKVKVIVITVLSNTPSMVMPQNLWSLQRNSSSTGNLIWKTII